ncbi:MAG: hypothetical protein JWN34_3173, partial [Bryobacterales bacterium]|nr:hypothetical protein [Bryobacterales bacterium]
RLTELGSALEKAALERDSKGAKQYLAELERYLANVKLEYSV